MYHMGESKSKLELFYWLLIELFGTFFGLKLYDIRLSEFETIALYTKVILHLSSAEVVFASS